MADRIERQPTLIDVAVEARSKADVPRLAAALATLAAEDSAMRTRSAP